MTGTCPTGWWWAWVLAAMCASAPGLASGKEDAPSAEGPARSGAIAEQVAIEEALNAARQAEAQGQWTVAELWLERALLLQPENAQVRFDWARLLLRRGERDAGLALLDSLATDPRTPEPQRQRITQLLQDLRRPDNSTVPRSFPPEAPRATADSHAARRAAAIRSPWRRSWEGSVGYSLNPLVQTSAREVALTLPQGSLVLPLEGQPHSATVGGMRAAWEHPGGVLLQAQVQAVAGQGVPSLRLGGLWSPGAWWGLYAQAQRLADSSRRAQVGAQALLPLGAGAGSAPRTALIGQISAYGEPDIPRQGLGLRTTIVHQVGIHWQLMAWLETETRQGTSGPPGWWLRGTQMEFKPRNDINLTLQVLDHNDTSGYSPLLENNAARHLKTLIGQAEWGLGERPGAGWAIRLHAGRRLSNLPLFAWEDAGVTLVWRAAW